MEPEQWAIETAQNIMHYLREAEHLGYYDVARIIQQAVQQLRAADGAKLSPIERNWSGEVEDEAWAYLQKPPCR